MQIPISYLKDSLSLFNYGKGLTERAMQQLTEEQLHSSLDPEMNSVAVMVEHLSGSMRSRWTDFLTSDGEKPDRDRDAEFVDPGRDRTSLMARWEQGWICLFTALEQLTDADMNRTITIRGESLTVMQAINRQLLHTSYHCGQIVFLAKHLQHQNWKNLSIPRGQSAEFNRRMKAGEASQR